RRHYAPGDRVWRVVSIQRCENAEKSLSAADRNEETANDAGGKDFCPAHGHARGTAWGGGGEARGHRLYAGRLAIQPRVRHADGGYFLRTLRGQKRAGE